MSPYDMFVAGREIIQHASPNITAMSCNWWWEIPHVASKFGWTFPERELLEHMR